MTCNTASEKNGTWTEIFGWLTSGEGEILQRFAKNRQVLELGNYLGRSTVALAEVAESVTSVDWHHGDDEIPDQNTIAYFVENLRRFKVDRKVEIIDSRIEDAVSNLMKRRWHMVFIDSAHDVVSVERDTRLAMSVLLPGGHVVWHDWDKESVRAGAKAAGIEEFMVEPISEGLGVLTARKWQVALVCPHYGQVGLGFVRTALASRGRIADIVPVSDVCSSALPHGFNGLLVQCLDWRDQGLITHMLMCHSDISPGAGALDIVTEEMARLETTVVSAVVPIKEPSRNPRTSTAIGCASDLWTPKRYIHVNDYGTMPDTFCGDDVCEDGEELLVNSAYMLVDLMTPFWDDTKFAFEFKTRINHEVVDGKLIRTAQFRSEDWEMSRHLNAYRMPYHATWKPKITHRGDFAWVNRPNQTMP